MPTKNFRDYFRDPEAVKLQGNTVAFFLLERQKLDDILMDCLNECAGDEFELQMEHGDLCDEAIRQDKRINAEIDRLCSLIDKERRRTE